MKKPSRFGISLALVALLVGASAIASDKDSRTIKLFYPATLGGSLVKAGEYNVKMESHSPQVTLTFIKQGKAVATTQGRWEERSTIPTRNEVVYDTNQDGSSTVSEIRFQGMKDVIVLNEFSRATQGNNRAPSGTQQVTP